ncbi:MAG: phosphonate metabolism protein/1,5-bisphosphokinase (PRPP-forming) PhnN [Sphingomonadaceae bacterium]
MQPERALHWSPCGLLILVLGASGAGKDTLLDGARAALAGNEEVYFAQREITRPADAGGEAHIAVEPDVFAARKRDGFYALNWCANGLCYGIPSTIRDVMSSGRRVVANGSRGALDNALAVFPQLRVILVTADEAILAERLAARGRENEADITARLARARQFSLSGDNIFEIRNDGTVAEGVDAMIRAILA